MKIRKKDGTFKEVIYDEKQLNKYGLNRLSERDWGRGELKKKMLRLQPDVEMVDRVLEKLEESGYLSTARRIVAVLNTYGHREGLRRTKQRMAEKGFTKEEIESVGVADNEKELEIASAALLRKFKTTDADYTKMSRFLVSRGFAFDVIKKAIKNKGAQLEEETG